MSAEEERRVGSLERILIELGDLKGQVSWANGKISELVERVGQQNGRVAKLEQTYAFIRGVVAIMVLLVIPLAVRFLGTFFDKWVK